MIITWIDQHARAILCIALALILFLAGILIWNKLQSPVPVTFESERQAETPSGVEQAANTAQVTISSKQAVAIANEIKEHAEKSPDAVVQTTGAKLESTVKAELQKSGGQFAIVTDDKQLANVPALPAISNKLLPNTTNHEAIFANTPITLNQYNIKAYPDRLIQIGGSYQELFAAYSWKVNVPKMPLIAPHGASGYLGIYGHANPDHPEQSRMGVLLTIPK